MKRPTLPRRFPSLFAASVLPLITGSASALDFHGLSRNGDRLVTFDMTGAVSRDVPVTGLSAGDLLTDIDVFFSGDRRLYGLGTSGSLYTIDPISGAATVQVPNAAVGSATAIDFNPAADRLRIFSGDENFRLTPGNGLVSVDGLLAYAGTDANAGADPDLRAAAYINNVDAPGSTALYSIDSGLDFLVLHSGGPQFSTLNSVAALTLGGAAFDAGDDVGFDIFSPMTGINDAFVSNGNDLYRIDLMTGDLFPLATVATTVDLRSIAVAVPEASTIWSGVGLLTVGALVVGRTRARRRNGLTRHPSA